MEYMMDDAGAIKDPEPEIFMINLFFGPKKVMLTADFLAGIAYALA